MYALVDCNNFYCSCERLFDPALKDQALIVLSNNDGCAIARSEEAKQLGVEMGTPAFMIRELIDAKKVKVFSSNYTLYGDISDRVMKTMSAFVPMMEIYSIDEAFLDMHDLMQDDLAKIGLKIRHTIRQNVGIPVSVGIAPTKTLAKMANRYAKKKRRDTGVFWAANKQLQHQMLQDTNVGDVWGIGHQHTLLLKKNNIHTALEFANMPEEWVRVNMSVVGQRMLNELKGIPAVQWEDEAPDKKNICTSRSFNKLLADPEAIKEAVVNHAATCALKLRNQHTVSPRIHVFIQTNLHRQDHEQYSRSVNVQLETPTNDTGLIIKAASKGFDMIFKPGYRYMKCGVVVCDIIPDTAVQQGMFENFNRERSVKMMGALDAINKSLGKEIVRFAVQGFERTYRIKADHLSGRYTTRMNEIIKVKK
ncbi:MAG: Y-family DNA polymerase [Chitinophagaceae bacterium]|nr:MAG: Y-family DNA polymerase [Chitinophagaceae bacterium]